MAISALMTEIKKNSWKTYVFILHSMQDNLYCENILIILVHKKSGVIIYRFFIRQIGILLVANRLSRSGVYFSVIFGYDV